ncbi:MAG TPA: hypothetical protein PKW14_09165 [Bacteroidota bacterium]|jgi:hypothetical protein|nr:hypothetical protein [Bacteroidota bacterium]
MDLASTIWMILFYIFSSIFFIIAGVVIFFGFKDLSDLLSKSEKK